ncbi:MAG: cytochrome c [Magnetococcus sp. YQC-5]
MKNHSAQTEPAGVADRRAAHPSGLVRRKTDIFHLTLEKNNIQFSVYGEYVDRQYPKQKSLKYLEKLYDFGRFLEGHGVTYCDADASALQRFLRLVQKKNSSTAQNRQYIIALIDFYLVMQEEGLIIESPIIEMYPLLMQAQLAEGAGVEPPRRDHLPIDSPIPIKAASGLFVSVYRYVVSCFFSYRLLKGGFTLLILLAMLYVTPRMQDVLQDLLRPSGGQADESSPPILVKPTLQPVSSIQRKDLFNIHQSFGTLCQTLFHVDCQANTMPSNPLTPTWENLTAGQDLFMQYCQACHGLKGKGVETTALGLNPPPTRLEFAGQGILHREIYLYWSISEGGEALETGMPAFKKIFQEKEIWQIILFMGTF